MPLKKYILDHLCTTIVQLCRNIFVQLLFYCFLDNAGARTAHLLADMKNAEICSVGTVKDGCEQKGKETKLCNCREVKRCHVQGEGRLFCSCQMYLQTLAATNKTKDSTLTAYFIHVKSFLDVQEAINQISFPLCFRLLCSSRLYVLLVTQVIPPYQATLQHLWSNAVHLSD